MSRATPTLVLLLLVTACSGCRVAADSGDAAASDGDASADGADRVDSADRAESADGDAGAPSTNVCDLLLQNCADRRQACYPDSTLPGATRCLFPGSGGPLAPCLLHEECDARLICIDSNRDGFTLCTPLCNPAARPTGCQGMAMCRSLTNYSAGTCDP